jgi:thioredoxin 2
MAAVRGASLDGRQLRTSFAGITPPSREVAKVDPRQCDVPASRDTSGREMTESLQIVCPWCDAVNRMPRQRLGQGGRCGVCHKPLFEGRPLPLDTARFDKHALNSDIPLLVDFWATWCGPCRTMAPIFEQAASRLEPQVRLVKVDSDASQDLASRFAIRSIPSLVLVLHGREIARTAGAMPLPQLIAWTQKHLPTANPASRAAG